jgi:predicted transposase/invertase (TIGR01784 family)
LLHIVELKDQECRVFYEKLKFIYIELPKFTKTIDELTDHFDKWLYLLRHLPDLEYPPVPLQNNVFMQLFEVAEIANFSREERSAYENSLKYYRDMHGVINTARREGMRKGMKKGIEKGIEKGREQGIQEGQRSLLFNLLARKLGEIPVDIMKELNQVDSNKLEALSEALFDLEDLEALDRWLQEVKTSIDG